MLLPDLYSFICYCSKSVTFKNNLVKLLLHLPWALWISQAGVTVMVITWKKYKLSFACDSCNSWISIGASCLTVIIQDTLCRHWAKAHVGLQKVPNLICLPKLRGFCHGFVFQGGWTRMNVPEANVSRLGSTCAQPRGVVIVQAIFNLPTWILCCKVRMNDGNWLSQAVWCGIKARHPSCVSGLPPWQDEISWFYPS